MLKNNKTSGNVSHPDGKTKTASGNKQEEEDEMFVLIDKKNPIVKDGKLVSSYDDPPLDDKKVSDKGKTAKKADDGFEQVPVYGGSHHK